MSYNKKLLILQPYFTKYRIPVFKSLSEKFNVCLCASVDYSFDVEENLDTSTFRFRKLKETHFFKNTLYWQSNLIKYFLKEKPDLLFLTANPRYLSMWAILILAKISNKKVFLHGQGLYSKNKISIFNKIIFYLFNMLSTNYICYTKISKESLNSLPIYNKSKVAENSIVNENPIEKQDTSNNGILFIGRLRKGSNLDLLINVVNELNENIINEKIKLHIIGGGNDLEYFKSKFSNTNINFYGAIYDNSKISEISKECIVGCYPGNAGLSVLHYMSLSLPVIVHSEIKKHMGPEVSYVIDKYNGFFFKQNNYESLQKTIKNIFIEKNEDIKPLQINAFHTYKNITTPSLSERFTKIIEDAIEEGL